MILILLPYQVVMENLVFNSLIGINKLVKRSEEVSPQDMRASRWTRTCRLNFSISQFTDSMYWSNALSVRRIVATVDL
jgi:hypothetical protein